jgi:hypothetical protein
MFLKNVVLYEIYSKKSQWTNTFGTSLCIIKNKFVIFHSFTIPKLNLIFYEVIFNTILISNIFPSSSKAAPSNINNIQFKVLIWSSYKINPASSWPMRSTSAVPRVISQLEDIFRMHHPTRINYCILHNEKYEKPRTKIFRRSYNVFPSPIL